MFRFGTTQSWVAYGNTRNTSLTFDVTLNGTGGTTFASSSNIKITVGADNFTALENPSGGTVTITINSGGSSIKKYDGDTPTEFTGGTGETLPRGTKLEIEATGKISNSSGSEVTIKGTLIVSSEGNLSNALTLGGDLAKDPSSHGLGGSITPQTSNGKVIIQNTSTINLTDNALEALNSLTQNAVTLTGGDFRSSASITVTGTSGNADLSTLDLSNGENLTITITSGTINNSDGKSELTTSTPLPAGTKLSLNANGQITKPITTTGTVKLEGTIVVTSNDQALGTNTLNFNGGPNRTGVSGTLKLTDEPGPPKHISIQASSDLTINGTAYKAIKSASDTTSSSFTIGAADPRIATSASGGADVLKLNNDESFTNYWHLLPSDRCDPDDIPYPEVIFPAMMIVLVATFFPPIIVATLQLVDATKPYSPKTKFAGATVGMGGWRDYGEANTSFYHAFDLLIVLKISLVVIFIYSVQYTLNRSGTDAAPECEITYDTSEKLTIKYKGTQEAKVEVTNYTPNGTNIGTNKWQYTATNAETKNITYTFTLENQLTGSAATPITTTVNIEYGHIFAEGFGGWKLYASEHKGQGSQGSGCDPSESKDVHAWF